MTGSERNQYYRELRKKKAPKKLSWEEKMRIMGADPSRGSLATYRVPVNMYIKTLAAYDIAVMILGTQGFNRIEAFQLGAVALLEMINKGLREKGMPEVDMSLIDAPEHHTGTRRLQGEEWRKVAERNGFIAKRDAANAASKARAAGTEREVGDGSHDVGPGGALQAEDSAGEGSGAD